MVIPTRQRAAKLPGLVGALEGQVGIGEFEVIIVDDASTDGTGDVLRRLAERSPLRITRLELPVNAGPATARNAGWRAARGPVVAFTDDDCLPTERWLEALLDAMRGHDMVQGCTVPDPAQSADLAPLSRTMEVRHENGLYETCNMAYRRDLLDRVGGFDERFRYPYGEDADLGWRARAAGARSRFTPDAVVYHEVVNPTFRAHLRELKRLDGAVLLLKLHPEARAYLYRGVFFRRSHPWVISAALGVIGSLAWPVPRRWRIGALLLTWPWLWQRLRSQAVPGDPSTPMAALPRVFVSDLAQVGVLAAASARHRALVL